MTDAGFVIPGARRVCRPGRIAASIVLMTTASEAALSFDLGRSAPPAVERRPHDVTVHGDTRIDEYFWLREREAPDVRKYLEQENAYTESVLAPAASLREALYREMVARIKEDDISAPIPYLGWLYYTRTVKDLQYPICCRRRDAPGSAEEVLVDLNKLAAGKPYVALGNYEVSDDGERLAYTVDWTGYCQYEVFVIDLATQKQIPHKIGLVADLQWAGGHDVLYYVTENEAKRSDKVHRWNLATGTGGLVLDEKDELYNVEVGKSNDGRFVFCTAESKMTSEVWAIDAADPAARPFSLAGRHQDRKYFAEHRGNRFYFVTNQEATNYKVVWAEVAAPAEWHDLIPHDPSVRIEDIDVFATHLVVEERENGLPHLRFLAFDTGKSWRIDLPDEVYDVEADSNWTYEATEYRYKYQSFARPPSVCATSFVTGERRLVKETEVLGGFDASNYVSSRVWVTVRDGVRIPLSVVHRRDLDRTRPQPMWLYGYGSYGISMPVTFSTTRISLLDRGWIFAVAHVRGGGELGEDWRLAGRMARKMTTFSDFVDCAQWLEDRAWTSPSELVVSGGSAGGLLIGAAVNLRPDLFRAAKLDVPFVDVINTMLDDSLPLTTEEYVEWGNPTIEEEYWWMRAYSPYDNLKSAAFPHLLVNVSFYDSQVPYWEGAKLLARARLLNTAKDRALLLHTNFGAGHSGASGRYDALRDVARDFAFFLTALR